MPTRSLVPSFSSTCLCPKASRMAAAVPDITSGLVFGSLFKSTNNIPQNSLQRPTSQMLEASEKHFPWRQKELEEACAVTDLTTPSVWEYEPWSCSSHELIRLRQSHYPLRNKPEYKKQHAGSGRVKRQKESGSLIILWPETPNGEPRLITWGRWMFGGLNCC